MKDEDDRDPSVYYRGCRERIYGLRRYEPGRVAGRADAGAGVPPPASSRGTLGTGNE